MLEEYVSTEEGIPYIYEWWYRRKAGKGNLCPEYVSVPEKNCYPHHDGRNQISQGMRLRQGLGTGLYCWFKHSAAVVITRSAFKKTRSDFEFVYCLHSFHYGLSLGKEVDYFYTEHVIMPILAVDAIGKYPHETQKSERSMHIPLIQIATNF